MCLTIVSSEHRIQMCYKGESFLEFLWSTVYCTVIKYQFYTLHITNMFDFSQKWYYPVTLELWVRVQKTADKKYQYPCMKQNVLLEMYDVIIE